jgi:hypothetical protein
LNAASQRLGLRPYHHATVKQLLAGGHSRRTSVWSALELTLSSRTQPFNMDIGQPTSFNLATHKAGRSSATFSERNMVAELIWQTTDKIFHTLSDALPTAIGCSIVLTALSLFSSQACNPDKRWWRNPGLFTDMCYFLVVPFIAPYMRMGLN